MSIVYYPKKDIMFRRDTVSASYEEVVLSTYPNTILYFGSGSELDVLSASTFYITASHAETASYTDGIIESASYAATASYVAGGVGDSVSSSWASSSISSSYATYASSSPQPAGTPLYFPQWGFPDGTLTSTSLIKENSGSIVINELAVDNAHPDALAIQGIDNSYNGIRVHGNTDSYFQINVKNINNAGVEASSDLVVTADDGTETTNYANLGINSSTYDSADFSAQGAHAGYFYSQGGNLVLGTKSANKIVLHAGGTEIQHVKVEIRPSEGLVASGSLYGSASFASSASSANSSSCAVSSSYSESSSFSQTASCVNPGAMLWVVSGSNGVAPAYLAPYDYSVDNVYRPYPRVEGYTHWDHKWVDWAVYDEVGARTHLGRELCIAVHNPSSFELPRLSPVYISGSSPSLNPTWSTYKPDVYLAQADGTGTKYRVAGVVRQAIPSGSDGYILIAGTMHNSDMTPYGNVGQEIWLSPSVAGGMTTTKPGQPNEVVSIGYNIEAGSVGSLLVAFQTEPPPANAFAGITSNITASNKDDGTIVLTTGSVNLFADSTGVGAITQYALPQTTLTLTTGSTNYVIAERSGSAAGRYAITTDGTYANGVNIVRVFTLYPTIEAPGEWEIYNWNIGIVGLALANRMNNRDIRLFGYRRESGLTLYVTGSEGDFGITAGNVWYGPNSQTIRDFQSFSASCETYHYVSSASVWSSSISQSFDNRYYNGVGGLVPLTVDSCSAVFVYRITDPGEASTILILSDTQYATITDVVNNAQPPADLPGIIGALGIFVGMIAFQSASYSGVSVQSSFATLFAPATITQHNNLLGIQGGTGGEYYHLTQADYAGTGTGLMVRANNATMSNPMFTAATPYHVPYWDVNKKLTLTGSLQVYEGQYVLINSASIDVDHPEALLVNQLNTSSVNAVGVYSSVNNYSQIWNQNFSSESLASTDIVATSDIGTQSSSYIDMGIASSNFNAPSWPWNGPSEGYLMMNGGTLWIGTETNNPIKFFINNTASVGYIDQTGAHLTCSLHASTSLSGSIVADISQDAPAWKEGTLFWDKNNHTYAIYNDQSEVTLQVGQETLIRVAAGENIPNGCPVYASGSSATYPLVKLALADGTRTLKYQVLGISTQYIASGSQGFVTVQGRVNDIDTSTIPAGAGIWLSYLNSGSFLSYPPPQPYERVLCGYCLYSDATAGKMLVDVVALPEAQNAYVGMTTTPTATSSSITPTGSFFTIGSASCNLCTSTDGKGTIKNYTIPEATFAMTASFLNVHYVVAIYNSGSPIYRLDTNRDAVDGIQTTVAYTVTPAAGGRPSFASWGQSGILLANKDYLRVQNLRKIEREDGLELAISDSTERYFTITEGTAWQGVQPFVLSPVTSSVDRVVLVAHSASVWSGSLITSLTNTMCDDGNNVVPLGAGSGHWVVNYIYRTIGTLNATLVMYSPDYTSVTDAIESQAPIPPVEMPDTAFLVGRVIYKKSIVPEVQTDSAYTNTFLPAGITVHNNLSGIQGGTTDEYYHLTAAEYTGTGTGVFVKQSGASITGSITNATSASYWNSSSIATLLNEKQWLIATGSTLPVTASWATNAINGGTTLQTGSTYPITASHAVTASYTLGIPTIKAGIVSGSLFAGTPKTASIAFVNAFPNNNYSVVVSGEPSRNWTIQNKSNTGFQINANNNTAFTTFVFWQAISIGEYYNS